LQSRGPSKLLSCPSLGSASTRTGSCMPRQTLDAVINICLDGSSSGGSISCATVASPWTDGCRCAITFVLSKPPCSAFALGGLSAAHSATRDAVSDDLFPTKDARALCSDATPRRSQKQSRAQSPEAATCRPRSALTNDSRARGWGNQGWRRPGSVSKHTVGHT
jgi:hypothetical protein